MQQILPLAIMLLMLNVVLSVFVLRDRDSTPLEHRRQLVLIWVLPVLGSLVCILILSWRAIPVARGGAGGSMGFPSDGGGTMDSESDSCGHGDAGGDCGGDGGD